MTLSTDLAALASEITKADFAGSKATLKARMDALASRYREAGESAFQSFNRIYTKGAGVSILRKYNSLRGAGYYEPSKANDPSTVGDYDVDDNPPTRNASGQREQPGDENGLSFTELVDRHQQRNPNMSRTASIDHVAATGIGRSALAMAKRHALTGA